LKTNIPLQSVNGFKILDEKTATPKVQDFFPVFVNCKKIEDFGKEIQSISLGLRSRWKMEGWILLLCEFSLYRKYILVTVVE
jgi:hypothetical protein